MPKAPAMPRQKAPVKRAYLARDDRREALLDVAASVVEQQGWQALSMISVAETAKVSRQLVYQHFSSVDELMADTMSHLFRGRYENIRSNMAGKSDDLPALVKMIDEQTFDEQPGRVRALWQMITSTYSDNAETSRMSTRLRHLLVKLWAPLLNEQFGLSEAQSRAMSWMLHMAFWGAHQLVHDGELSRKAANELFTWMLMSLQNSGAKPVAIETPSEVLAIAKAAPPRSRKSVTAAIG